MTLRKHLLALGKTALVGAAAFAAFTVYSEACPYRMVWNHTASIPQGLYLAQDIVPGTLERGQLGCFAYHAPDWAQARHYFPDAFTLCKPVVAMAGDVLARQGDTLWVTAQGVTRAAGTFAHQDSAGRPLPQDALALGAVPEHALLMLAGAHANSLDSRYLGLVPVSLVRTRVRPILTW